MENKIHTDPSENVRAALHAEVKRLDDLAIMRFKAINDKVEAEVRRIDEKIKLQSESSVLLNVAEAKRIDAIRAVDVNAVSVANEKATAQAVVLANQVTASAETLRSLVAATATTTAQQLAALTAQINDRLSALEKSQYENKGSGSGMKDLYGWIVGGIGLAIGLYLAFNK